MGSAKPRERKLTAKEQLFAVEYLVDLNATQAAIRAGYSPRSARVIGPETLSKPAIAQAIAKELEKRKAAARLNVQEVEERLAELLRFDPAEAYAEDGTLLPVRNMPKAIRRQLAGVETEELFTGRGEEREHIGDVRKVKWVAPDRAVELAARRFGLLKDKVETRVTLELDQRKVTPDEWKALAALRHEVRRSARATGAPGTGGKRGTG